MKIIEKIKERNTDNHKYKIPKIVTFGDSVTQGCFEVYDNGDETIRVVYDKNSAYSKLLSDALFELFPYASVTIHNAGISGDSTEGGLKRLERDVISECPDLVIISFGLNDCVVKGKGYEDTYAHNLKEMFLRAKEIGAEVIYLTPPMMCKNVSPEIEGETLRGIAADVAKAQNEGLLDLYCECGKAAARECGVKIADLHKKWVRMADVGVNTDALLSNHINHPKRSMNKLAIYTIMETLLEE